MTLHPNLRREVIAALGDLFARGAHAEAVVDARLRANRKWGARDRRFFAECVYENVRWWRWHWHLAGLPDAECLQPAAVTEARASAVLDAYLAQRETNAPKDPAVPLAIRESVPDWLNELGEKEFAADWPALLAALNRPAEVFLRANTLRTTALELKATLAQQGIEAETVAGLPDALRLRERRKLASCAAFRDGLFEIQDAASQHVAPLLHVAPGQTVMDACCGAGGKTLHLAALLRNEGRLLALDVREEPLNELARRAARAGVTGVELGTLDREQTHEDLFATADRVLLDVPCSGLGTLRRHADVKWKMTPKEIARLIRVQARILAGYANFTRPGGKLVYATCSILPDENERQVRAFLAAHGDAWTLEEELHLRPDRAGFDGFYAARLGRKA
jgi:16S rRNA (cytosine967-C5)-methyltransferase